MFASLKINVPNSPLFRFHKIVDYGSSAIVLTAFYGLLGKLFSKRLEIGRDLVARREWEQAVTTLQPFDTGGQRFLDRTGEPHYLLAQAYAGVKKNDEAAKCRQFVLKYRRGPWAVKLGGQPAPQRTSRAADVVAPEPTSRPRPSKSKPKRRF
jgi:hypothetical protein